MAAKKKKSNSGRKQIEKEYMLRRNVTLNDKRIKKLEKIGGGNISAGIRIVTDAYKN